MTKHYIDFLITTHQLNELMNTHKNIVIVDVRDKESFQKGHILQAINAPEVFSYLPEGITSADEKADFVQYFSNLFSELGVCKDELVIFYEDKYTLKSPRGVTILKYLGYEENNIKVLEGGYENWQKANMKTTTFIDTNKRKFFNAVVDEDFFVDYNEMKDIVYDDNIVVIDTRDKDEWLGISSSPYGLDFAPKKGRLPNAIWIEWYNFITENMQSVENLEVIKKKLDEKNVKKDDTIVLYCFKGARLSNSYIAFRKLGFENIRIYFAGWNEWCRKSDAPIINELENCDNEILKENIALKIKLDKANIKNSKLINFPKYNKEPVFSFNRDGDIEFQNNSKIENLSTLNSFYDIYTEAKPRDINNFIDNMREQSLTYWENDKYYLLNLKGSRELNKILVYGFETTELNLSYKSLQKEKEKAQKATQAKSDFLANMSHEIRTPMNAIVGMLYILEQTRLDDKQKKHIETINKSITNLLHIINDILDFSKLEAKKLMIENVYFDIRDLLYSIKDSFQVNAQENQNSINIDISKDIAKIYYADKLRVSQVLTNLLSNAIKFTQNGTINIIVTKTEDSRVRFVVQDTGIGIKEEDLEKLFKSFSQADSSITRQYGGTGLGLSISKHLVELMGGDIWVKSKEGEGSAFYVDIKLQEQKSKRSKELSSTTNILTLEDIKHLKNTNILLVEDNSINQEIVVGLLDGSGINIDIINNGKEAVDLYNENKKKYQLILMDIQMPILDGYEATKIIREDNKTIAIVALSASAMSEDKEKTKSAGMDAHLTKPIDINRLYETLVKYIDSSKSDLESSIDSKSGLRNMANNKELYKKVLIAFYNQYKDIDINKILDDEKERFFHTLKGLALNIGAESVANIASKIERNSKDKDLYHELKQKLDEVLDELKILCNENSELEQLSLNRDKKSIKKDTKSILIVDDTLSNLKLLEFILNSYNIYEATNANDALKIVQNINIDLILLDIVMPDTDGYELCQMLKENPRTKDIPVVFITAKTDEQSIEKAYDVGGIDYVTKPFKQKELLARVKTQLKLQNMQQELQYLASIDPMTKLYNRRYFTNITEQIIVSSVREKYPLSLIILDIDKFKKINDTFGHQVGDEVIIALANKLISLQRKNDIVCRYGGEEFIILLPNTSIENALLVAQNIRKDVEDFYLILATKEKLNFTISLGVSSFNLDKETEIEPILKRADDALYKAKEGGRNRVCVS